MVYSSFEAGTPSGSFWSRSMVPAAPPEAVTAARSSQNGAMRPNGSALGFGTVRLVPKQFVADAQVNALGASQPLLLTESELTEAPNQESGLASGTAVMLSLASVWAMVITPVTPVRGSKLPVA